MRYKVNNGMQLHSKTVNALCTPDYHNSLLAVTTPSFGILERSITTNSMNRLDYCRALTEILDYSENIDLKTAIYLYVPVDEIDIVKDVCCMAFISVCVDELQYLEICDDCILSKERVEKHGYPYWVYETFVSETIDMSFTRSQFNSLLDLIEYDDFYIKRIKNGTYKSIIEEMNCNYDITGLIQYMYHIHELYLCQLYNNINSSFAFTFDIIKAIYANDVSNVTMTSECEHTILIDLHNKRTAENIIEW